MKMIEEGSRSNKIMVEKRQLFMEMRAQNFDVIRLSTYRTACKLRFVQKRCNLHLVDVWNMIEAFRDNGLSTLDHSAEINVSRLETILSSIFYQLNKRLPTTHQINVEQSIGLLLNFMVATYDSEGHGKLTVFSMKSMLATMCGGKIVDKLRYIFSQISDSSGTMVFAKFDQFLREVLKLPTAVFEGPSFGYTEHSVRTCFPQQAIFHPVECSYCRSESMMGFRYRCQQCHGYQLCQNCFWRGHASGPHSNQHQMKEHSSWKSPAKKLSHAISKSLGCVPMGEPPHPVVPEAADRPQDPVHPLQPHPASSSMSDTVLLTAGPPTPTGSSDNGMKGGRVAEPSRTHVSAPSRTAAAGTSCTRTSPHFCHVEADELRWRMVGLATLLSPDAARLAVLKLDKRTQRGGFYYNFTSRDGRLILVGCDISLNESVVVSAGESRDNGRIPVHPSPNGAVHAKWLQLLRSFRHGRGLPLMTRSPGTLESPSRLDEEHRLIARYAARLAAEASNSTAVQWFCLFGFALQTHPQPHLSPLQQSPPTDLSFNFDANKQQRQLIAELENKNREILQEIQRLRLEHEQASQPTPEKAQQNPTLLAELRLLRHRKDELEKRMSALQESRRELMVQLEGLMRLLKAQSGGSPHSSPSHSASCTMPMPIRSTSAGSTPTHTPQDCLAGVGDDVLDAFSQGVPRNLRNDLLVAADSITNTMSSLVKELHSGNETAKHL
ncbi:hypothetical protein P4O66_011906 [Electrophorus voltai]|uniref:Dystrobrevin n=1 Tax=Electrophorus voltai TaxID=2609070 RepID=A0AAD8Z6Q3_9TELE|nr:hypothetical protein P4O66_011906 [Electrophorus voltai]